MHRINSLPLAEAAKRYRAMGWIPIPLREKRPITNWTTDPPLTDEQLDLLFPVTDPGAPHLNLGIRMGACSGIIALDIDGLAGRDFVSRNLTPREIWRLQQTLNFSTPNGHRLIYQYPLSPEPSRSFRDPNNTRHELVRVLSDGTQTVAPPSDINGSPYLWTQHNHTLAPWPADLVALLDTPAVIHPRYPTEHHHAITNNDKNRRAAAYLRKCDPAVAGHGGHDQTYKIAVRLVRGFELNYHEALALITEIYNPTCQPPWSDAELEHKIESALKDTNPTRNML